ncbi:MAG: PHP domain-containing protein [Lachnospiraceae bacterium]|nr:PHP domain-containing protein [Lachnospiraceae bacterium]
MTDKSNHSGNTNKRIDLHVHSSASDGTLAPAQVVKLAYDKGLSAIALTDHDTVMGVEEAMSVPLPIEVIPGIELSAGYGDGDIHILGLYVNYKSEKLIKISEDVIKERDWRNNKMAENLADAGIDITVDKIREIAGADGVITRAHFARFLVENNYVRDKSEAFSKYLATDTPYFVKRRYLSPEECIRVILECGGIPVLAHPMLYKLPQLELEGLISRLKSAGLAGIEAIYSTYTPEEEDYVRTLAVRFKLKITGGSDFHGSNKPDINIGSGRGNLSIPYSLLSQLQE